MKSKAIHPWKYQHHAMVMVHVPLMDPLVLADLLITDLIVRQHAPVILNTPYAVDTVHVIKRVKKCFVPVTQVIVVLNVMSLVLQIAMAMVLAPSLMGTHFANATKDIRVANAATNVPFIIIFPVLVMENVPVNNLPKVPLKQDIASAMVHTRATTAV
jgi:hypothetical protein